MARDNALPGAKIFARVNPKLGVPVYAIILMTVVQMLLGLINLGSTSAFTAFVSVGVQALALSYAIPIAISLFSRRKHVSTAPWKMPSLVGKVVNVIALVWIAFEVVLFSMPTALPVTEVTMNYASVVLVGFMAIAAIWYVVHARKGKLYYSRLKS
jgi:amino acid transporter